MLEDVIYINHLNEVVEMNGRSGIFCNKNDLRDFNYSVTTKNGRISAFSKGVVKKALPIVVACADEGEGIAAKNRLFEVLEKDILASRHGRLFIGDYYLRCFVTGSAKSDYFYRKGYLQVTLTIQTDLPEWIRESVTAFGYAGAGKRGNNMDFNSDFPFDYASNLLGKSVINAGFVPSNFRITFYGAAENPSVTVRGHPYQVYAMLLGNEYITVDSVSKTILLTHTDGVVENVFNKRNKESYIFEKIPTGVSLVELAGCQKADITLLEERGEPRWI